VLVLVLALSGCASSNSEDGTFGIPRDASEALKIANANGFDWEVGVLEDGIVSSSEYEEAYDRFIECAVSLGYVFDQPKYMDPVEGLVWRSLGAYEGVGEAPEEEEMACENRREIIEAPYALNNPKRMDPRLLAGFQQCLDKNGIAYEGTEVSYNDFTKDLSEEEFMSGPRMTCLQETAVELFPDLLAVSVSR